MVYLIVAALAFAVCYGLDKGFTRLFRNKKEHRSGRAVKHHKRLVTIGLLLALVGLAGLLSSGDGFRGQLFMSLFVLALAVGLIVYYLSFGIYYDQESFLVSNVGKKQLTYRYGEIREQRLYVVQGGSMLVELHMTDGTAVSVQSTMDGALPFLDYAFARWCEQKNLDPKSCEFHDPSQYRWFPEGEAK